MFAAVAAALSLAASDPAAGDRAALGETRCTWLVQPEGGPVDSLAAPPILEQTALPGAFGPDLPADVRGLQCGRTSIVPAEHDDEVLALGIPFYIVEVTGTESGRLGVIEISQGQFRYRLLEGKLSEAEAQAVTARLNAFQAR
jgi:hypothetical protein